MLDHVFVEFELCQVAGARHKRELRGRCKREQRTQPPAARAVTRDDLTDVHLNLVAHLAALTAAGIFLRHSHLPNRVQLAKFTPGAGTPRTTPNPGSPRGLPFRP